MSHHPTCATEIYFPGEGSCNQETEILHVSWQIHSERKEEREREKGRERKSFCLLPNVKESSFGVGKKVSILFCPRMKAFDSWGEKKDFITLSRGADDYIKFSIHWNENAFPIRKTCLTLEIKFRKYPWQF